MSAIALTRHQIEPHLPSDLISLHSTPAGRSNPQHLYDESQRSFPGPPRKRRKLGKTQPLGIPKVDVASCKLLDHVPHFIPRSSQVDDVQNLSASCPGLRKTHTSLYPDRPRVDGRPHSSHAGIRLCGTNSCNVVSTTFGESPLESWPNDGDVDFFPWCGEHVEDTLNELTTKNGLYDKPHAAHNESSTARPSVWSSLRHKAGLQTLSTLFMTTLQQRQNWGRLCSFNTFKLPPRVTLTDAKRETWLKGLSNPGTSLRTLSRSIPHGIRGKALLDHCLQKDVPISRAVWLARCVGANEIRAFRRKGANSVFTVGGDVKWVRDWTGSVEQFLYSVVTACGASKWHKQFDYGLRLTHRLNSAQLLDIDQFFEWLTRSVTECERDLFGSWLVVVKTFLVDILKWRRTDKIVRILWQHFQRITSLPMDKSLIEDLREISTCIVILAPTVSCSTTILERADTVPGLSLEGYRARWPPVPKQLYQPDIDADRDIVIQKFSTQAQTLYDLEFWFQSLSPTSNIRLVARRALGLSQDCCLIVKSCIRWCCRSAPMHKYRIFLTVRLLRHWKQHNLAIECFVIVFLEELRPGSSFSEGMICHLLSELIQIGQFSVHRYLHWLLAAGLDDEAKISYKEMHFRLLSGLPFVNCGSHAIRLRDEVAHKLGLDISDEQQLCTDIRVDLSACLSTLSYQQTLDKLDATYARMSHGVKHRVSMWLRHSLEIRQDELGFPLVGIKDPCQTQTEMSFSFAGSDRIAILVILLVLLDQYHFLADIMQRLAYIVAERDLVTLVDTCNRYSEIFLSMGALDRLYRAFYSRVDDFESQNTITFSLIGSLSDLSEQLPGIREEANRLAMLRHQLSRISSHPAAGVCSPVYDTMVEVTSSSNDALLDEVDQIFSLGTHVEEQTTKRVFATITGRLTDDRFDNVVHARLASLLSRLLTHKPSLIRALLAEWLTPFLTKVERPALSKVLSPLACHRIMSVEEIISSVLLALQQVQTQPQRQRIAMEALNFLTPTTYPTFNDPQLREYRLYHGQKRAIVSCPWDILEILQQLAPTDVLQPSHHGTLPMLQLHPYIKDIVGQCSETDAATIECIPGNGQDIGDWLVRVNQAWENSPRLWEDKILELLESTDGSNHVVKGMILNSLLDAKEASSMGNHKFFEILHAKITMVKNDQMIAWVKLVATLSLPHVKALQKLLENTLITLLTDVPPHLEPALVIEFNRLLKLYDASTTALCNSGARAYAERDSATIKTLLQAIESLPSVAQQDRSAFMQIKLMSHVIFAYEFALEDTLMPIPLKTWCLTSFAGLFSKQNLLDTFPIEEDIYMALAILVRVVSMDHVKGYVNSFQSRSRRRSRYSAFMSRMVEDSPPRIVLKTRSTSSADLKSDSTREVCVLRKWEMISDASPMVAENDSCLNMALFGSQEVRV